MITSMAMVRRSLRRWGGAFAVSVLALSRGLAAQTDQLAPRAGAATDTAGGRQCQLAPLPAVLPSAAQLADSATIGALLQRDSLVAGRAVFRVHFDAMGVMNGFGLIESDLAPTEQRQVALIIANLMHAHSTGRPYGLRIGVTLGRPAKLTVARSEYCRPALGAMEPEAALLQVQAGARRVRRNPRWEVSVATDGRVVGLRLLDPTGYPELEATAREQLLRAAFRPALLDGKPLAVVDTLSYEVSGYAR